MEAHITKKKNRIPAYVQMLKFASLSGFAFAMDKAFTSLAQFLVISYDAI